MKRWVKRMLVGIGVIAALTAGLAAAGYQMADRKMTRRIQVDPAAVAYAEDPESIRRGEYLYQSRGCAECHGADGGGKVFLEDGSGLRVAGANITSGGVTAAYTPPDWVRTVRHGVKPGGQPVMVMPSEDYNRLTDQDLASLVAYLRSLPPRPGGGAIIEFPLPVRVLYGFGTIADAASKIDHSLPPAQAVPELVSPQHGAYVANMCIGCHGKHLSGGRIAGGPPDWPPAANITPGSNSAMARYPDPAAFVAMLRSGRRPDGTPIKVMPFGSLSKLNDVDAQALYAYLKTVPPRPAGEQ